MPHKGAFAGVLAASLAAASLLGGAVHAAGQSAGVDRDAAQACMALGDNARVAQCLQELTPLSLEEQRVQAMLDDPAVQAALDAWHRQYESAMALRAQQLARQGDVRSLLGAMMIMPTQDAESDGTPGVVGAQAREWFARARQLGPTDPLVAWVEMVDCHVLDCDRDAAVARLLGVDGDNAAAHVWAMSDALNSGDLRAARAHLRSAASARRHDPHTGQMLSLLLDARKGASVPAMDANVSTVMAVTAGSSTPTDFMALQALGQWAAIAMAPMQGVARLCGPDSPELARDPSLRRDCVALLTKLAEDNSTLVYAQFSTRLLMRLDPALANQWAPRMRQLTWWQEQSVPLMIQGGDAIPAAEYAGWVATQGELGAMAKLLARAGIPPKPPADWRTPENFR